MEPQVILVDSNDVPIGKMNKLEAHEKGLLHRAISVLIFNSNGDWLLQQRAQEKYHSPLLWSNTACSHPEPGEQSIDAAKRRLNEEMGLSANLKFAFSFVYKVSFSNGLTEHEYDHVFIAKTNSTPVINKSEAQDFKYVSQTWLMADIKKNPENYTEWFKILVPKVIDQL